MQPLQLAIRRLFYKCLRLYWRVRKPIVLGSRVLVVRDEKVLLVRLSYTDGWYLPGGGVDRGESFQAAAIRELREECALEAKNCNLFGLYTANRRDGKIDHVGVYVITEFTEISGVQPDNEILEIRFFPLQQLPTEATPATRRRIQEYLAESEKSDRW